MRNTWWMSVMYDIDIVRVVLKRWILFQWLIPWPEYRLMQRMELVECTVRHVRVKDKLWPMCRYIRLRLVSESQHLYARHREWSNKRLMPERHLAIRCIIGVRSLHILLHLCYLYERYRLWLVFKYESLLVRKLVRSH